MRGRKKVGRGRNVLINAKYFGGMCKDAEELWWEVYWYIEQTYYVDAIEIIFITGGDGASWITLGGAEFMVNGGYACPTYFICANTLLLPVMATRN